MPRTRQSVAWLAAICRWSFTLHFNDGIAAAPPGAIAASRSEAMNPRKLDAFVLAVVPDDGGG